MLEERTIFLGERRRVALNTWLVNGAPFDIADPTYEISVNGEVIDQGVPSVEPHGSHWFLQCYVEPTNTQPHIVAISYNMGEEHIIRKLRLNVRK